MRRFNEQDIPDEVRDVARQLRAERPRATPLELDRIKVRAMRRGSVRTPNAALGRKGSFMRSRLAIVAVVALGIVMSGGGAALAVSGLSGTSNAATSQYGPNHSNHHNSSFHTLHPSSSSAAVASEATHYDPNRSLPFTGYAAIPVLVIGVALLGGGLALGWRVRRTE